MLSSLHIVMKMVVTTTKLVALSVTSECILNIKNASACKGIIERQEHMILREDCQQAEALASVVLLI